MMVHPYYGALRSTQQYATFRRPISPQIYNHDLGLGTVRMEKTESKMKQSRDNASMTSGVTESSVTTAKVAENDLLERSQAGQDRDGEKPTRDDEALNNAHLMVVYVISAWA